MVFRISKKLPTFLELFRVSKIREGLIVRIIYSFKPCDKSESW